MPRSIHVTLDPTDLGGAHSSCDVRTKVAMYHIQDIEGSIPPPPLRSHNNNNTTATRRARDLGEARSAISQSGAATHVRVSQRASLHAASDAATRLAYPRAIRAAVSTSADASAASERRADRDSPRSSGPLPLS